MSKILNHIIFFFGIFLACIFYVLASYYFRLGEMTNDKFIKIFLISILCGLISFSIKIPTFYFFAKDLNVMLINIIYVTMIFIVVTIFSKFVLKETIKLYTYIIISLIILLILLNSFLDMKYNS
jgi:hypothetical protein